MPILLRLSELSHASVVKRRCPRLGQAVAVNLGNIELETIDHATTAFACEPSDRATKKKRSQATARATDLGVLFDAH